MIKALLLIHIYLICLSPLAYAQEVSLTVSAPSQVAGGQQFMVTFSVNAEAESFSGPSFKDFNVLGGPNSSTSSNIQIFNNQVIRSVTYAYTYYLSAGKEGSFAIGEAKVRTGGKTYSSQPFTIQVVPSTQQGAGQAQPRSPQPQQGQRRTLSDKDILLRVSANKSNPYQGEEVIITYRIFTRVPIVNYTINQAPAHTGFWSEDLIKNNQEIKQYKEMIDGEEYLVAEIRKVALYAQRSGSLRLEPLKLDVVAQVVQSRSRFGDPFFDNFFNDPFFNSGPENVPYSVTSNALTLEVRPLPIANKPASFKGAVGDFTMQTTIDRKELNANESITLKIAIKGKGNVKLIQEPDAGFPASFESFDPKTSTDVNANASGVSGTRTFEYLAIPRSSGEYTLSPQSFTYFNPSAGQYITLTNPVFSIKVKRGEGNAQAQTFDPADRQSIQYVGSDIRYIKQGPFRLFPVQNHFFGSTLFWILLLLPFVLFVAFVAGLRQHISRNSDISKVRYRRATRLARKRLNSAHVYLTQGQNEKFVNEIAHALWGFISDKFNIPLADLSMENVKDRLTQQGVDESIILGFERILNNCEFARFAPGNADSIMETLFAEAFDLLTRLEKDLK